jgi:tyrosyl-tRNA synthetase
MKLKKELAYRVTSELKSKEGAQIGEEYFESVFQNKSSEADLEEIGVQKDEYDILELITQIELAPSKSQARRLVEQGAVKIDEEKVKDWQETVKLTKPIVLKVGKQIIQITYQP